MHFCRKNLWRTPDSRNAYWILLLCQNYFSLCTYKCVFEKMQSFLILNLVIYIHIDTYVYIESDSVLQSRKGMNILCHYKRALF